MSDNSLFDLLNSSILTTKTWDCASTALKTKSNGTPKCTIFMESARSCKETEKQICFRSIQSFCLLCVCKQTRWPIDKYVFVNQFHNLEVWQTLIRLSEFSNVLECASHNGFSIKTAHDWMVQTFNMARVSLGVWQAMCHDATYPPYFAMQK